MTKLYTFLLISLLAINANSQEANKHSVTDIQSQLEFLSPKPNSQYHNINAQIILRVGGVLDISKLFDHPEMLDITGELSGSHEYDVNLSSDEETLIIASRTPFSLSEEVTISLDEFIQLESGDYLNAFEYSFFTSSLLPQAARDTQEEDTDENIPLEIQNRENPEVVTLINNSPAPGNIFFCALVPVYYLYILDSEGSSPGIWEMEDEANGTDFKVNRNNLISWGNMSDDTWRIIDHSGEEIMSRSMQNGYVIDMHDFQILEDSHSFMFAYDDQIVDMSEIVEGGNPNAQVEGFVIQELDENENLVFEWRSWDYFEITDNQYVNLTGTIINPFHINSLEIDSDENLIISCRHTDEITKIDRSTGDLIWRWGGTQNEFLMPNDSGFTYQHDARRLENGNILLFDNGNFNVPQVSRSVEYTMDTVTQTVQKVWEFIHPDNLYSSSKGNCQRLPNGNTIINWGNVALDNYGTRITEVNQQGDIELEIAIVDLHSTYRVHKYDWMFNDSLGGCGDTLALNFVSEAFFFDNDLCLYDLDGDGFTSDFDCDDSNEDINPDMEEIPYDGIDQDCDGEDLTDVDGDGFSIADDCNDNDEEINPDVEEIPYDGIDQDCDGEDLTDVDGDGFSIDEDCNDDDESINPDAEEIANDGIDQDCDGEDLIVGLGELEENGFAIFPNPVVGEIHIMSSKYTEYNVEISNAIGQRIIELKGKGLQFNIPVHDLIPGMYFLSLEFESSKVVQQLIIR